MSSPVRGDDPAAEVSPYIGYLDKEMTIMAALSAFAIASVALVMNVFAGDVKAGSMTASIWQQSAELIVGGGAAQLLAALYFYLQRSNLAWMYGQICLTLVPEGHPDGLTTRDAIIDADSWSTWVSYRIAFWWLCLGYVLYGMAFANQLFPQVDALWKETPKYVPGLPFAAIALASLIEWRVLNVFATKDHPWCLAWSHPGRLFTSSRG